MLSKLLIAIRSGKDDNIESLVRSNASVAEIAEHLGIPSPYSSNPEWSNELPPRTEHKERQDRAEKVLQLLAHNTQNSYVTPGYVEVFGNLPFSSALPSAGYDEDSQKHQISNFRIPEYQIQPLNYPESGGMVTAFAQNFVMSSRQALAAGASPSTVLGPVNMDLDVLLRPRIEGEMWTPAIWAYELQRSFERVDKVTRLSLVYFNSLYMRVS